ncbi:MAG: efflux RND transporter periplasmic adaptor subunit [Anaerolineae bacterium]
MKKKWWIVVGVAVLLGAVYGGYVVVRRLADARASLTVLTQETAFVERGDLRATVDASGSIVAADEVALSFTANGRVDEVLVEVGDYVEAGELLIHLEADDKEEAVQQAEIALAQARLDLRGILDGPSAEDVAAAEAALRGVQADYASVVDGATEAEIAKAETSLARAEASLASAQGSYDRTFAHKPNEDPDYTSAANQLWSAQAVYEKALASYNATVGGATDNERWLAWVRVQQSQASLDRLLEQPTDEAVRLAELAVSQAEIDLARAEYDLEQMALTAPFAGTVTALNAEEGEMAGAPVVVISDLDVLTVDLLLDETDVAQITVGQLAVVTLDALADVELTGTITYVAPTAIIQSGVVLFPVTVMIDATDEGVRAGMTADVELITASVEDVLLVPVNAVQNVNGRTIVLRKLAEGETVERPGLGSGERPAQGQAGSGGQSPDDLPLQGEGDGSGNGSQLGTGGFIPVPVETGARSETQVEIVRGLEEGDEIVLADITELTERFGGQRPFPGMGMIGGHP